VNITDTKSGVPLKKANLASTEPTSLSTGMSVLETAYVSMYAQCHCTIGLKRQLARNGLTPFGNPIASSA
jgi:hypothetical protein